MRKVSIYKKAKRIQRKKENKKSDSVLKMYIIWALSAVFFIWLTFVLWGVSEVGPWGTSVRTALKNTFGLSTYLLPLCLVYWLWRSVKSRSLVFFTLLFGVFFALVGISGEASFLHNFFDKGNIMGGGYIGDFFYKNATSLLGKVGAVLLGLAFIFIGIHILFNINWIDTYHKIKDILKEDFTSWMQARADLKAKFLARELEEKEEESKKENIAQTNIDSTEAEPKKKTPPQIMRTAQSAEMVKNPPRSIQPSLFNDNETSKTKIKSNKEKQETKETEKSQENKVVKEYNLPPLDLLNLPESSICGPSDEEINKATNMLETTFKNFNIAANVVRVVTGPVVTCYEVKPETGVKISSILSISNDIALAMKARSLRIEAPIPGKDAIGIEIPNDKPAMVSVREILQDKTFTDSKYKTTIVLGRYADGKPATSIIEKMPHVLIAGATNSGKSICVHSMIASLLYRAKPDEVKLMLIDPKRVELTFYEGIPHLYDPKTSCEDADIIKDASGAVKSLQALVKVMEKRMKIFEIAKVKNIEGYNAWAVENNEDKMFYIVVIIDEMADLMLQTKSAIEDSVQRLAQMGRALGIHLVLCTQRPSTNVITGVIKANLPSRIALQVASAIDSRVVLDANGADTLLGKGDMLYIGISDSKPKRIQGSFISEKEITALTNFWRAQGGPDYPLQVLPEQTQNNGGSDEGLGTSSEEMLAALTLIMERRRVSQDLLKSHFHSSARATNLLSLLEVKGFISKPEGTNRWEIHFDLIEQQIAKLKTPPSAMEEEYETIYK